MKWSILILTMPQRKAMLYRLTDILLPQVASHDDVELIVRRSKESMPVGENRELLRQEAKGEYISFVDDDDLVHPQFVHTILPKLDGVDYVGFNVEQRINGSLACIERRSLQFTGVSQDNVGGHFRDISHLNPMRRELAMRVPMTGWPGEDTRWADGIRELGIVKTEHYIDEVLYYYLFRTVKPEENSLPVSATMEVYPWDMKKTKIKMLVSMVGNAEEKYDLPEFGWAPGQIVEVHPEKAESLIASGLAERVGPAPEVAVMPEVETAVEPSAASKGRKKVAEQVR